MNKTNIEYLDFSWNPIVMRCSPISEGCVNCWHIAMCDRLAKNPMMDEYEQKTYSGEGPLFLFSTKLKQPMKRKKSTVIGVQLMGDLFYQYVTYYQQKKVVDAILESHQHTFIILTKRSNCMREFFNDYYSENKKLSNVIIGVTTENQKRYDERIEPFFDIPGKKWLSLEPLLEPIILHGLENIDWVVVGCESGKNRRYMSPDWVRSIRNQCIESETPFFLKQMAINGKVVKMPELDGKVWDQKPF